MIDAIRGKKCVLVRPTTSSGNARGWGIVSWAKMSEHTISSDLANGDMFERGMGVSCDDIEDELGIRDGIELVGYK